jgi:hypothetical protein
MARIEAGSPRSTEDDVRTGDILVPDLSGDVTTQFRRLLRGYSYGLGRLAGAPLKGAEDEEGPPRRSPCG